MLSHHGLLFKRHMRGAVYELSFLSSLAASILSFFTGTLAVSLGLSDAFLGIIFAGTSLLSLVLFFLLPRYTHIYPLRTILIGSATLFTAGLIINAASNTIFAFMVSLLLSTASYGILLSILDMYVERGIDMGHPEGTVRGLYLAFANAAYIMGPFVGGLLIEMGGFPALFLGATVSIIPFLGIAYAHLPKVSPISRHVHTPLKAYFSHVFANHHLRTVYIVYFLLRIFFSVVGIYTAIYLVSHQAFTYWQAGLVITISLIPMVIFEIPVGKLLDTTWKHSTVGAVGFSLIAITSGIVPYINTNSIYIWALLFFCMRIGASLVEIVAETYFFHHIDSSNAAAVSVFRGMFPISSLVAPLCASFILYLFSFDGLFTLLAFACAAGALVSTHLTERAS